MSRISRGAAQWATLLLALAATQVVRFENRVVVSWDGRDLVVESHHNRIARPVAGPLLAASTSLQRSMVGDTVLAAYTLDGPAGRVTDHEPPVYYAFGRDWTGNAIRASTRHFAPSFGDWTMDRYRTEAKPLQVLLPPRFTLAASFLGRGEKSLLFATPGGTVSVNVRDGFLDNDVSICEAGQCTAERSREPVVRNLSRLLSTALESFVLGGFLLLLAQAAAGRPATEP